jgi:hypothetical protein
VAVGAVMLAIPASAVALTAGSADAQSALQVSLDRQHLDYGQRLTVSGTAQSAARGQKLWLDYEPAGGRWHAIGATGVNAKGRFQFVTTLPQTGAVRVVGSARAASATGPVTGVGAVPAATSSAAVTPSPPLPVSVRARLKAPLGPIDALTGQSVNLGGRLLPATAGRLVKLQYGTGHGWNTLATARTRGNGQFDLRYSPATTGQQFVRLSFPGDAHNGHVATQIVPLTTYRQSVASWYDDSGSTACGFHAGMGVANRDLPCGTKVTFHYNGRSVTAVVDDRGPFVGGRDWDLNQNVAGALGFGGVDTVWSSM